MREQAANPMTRKIKIATLFLIAASLQAAAEDITFEPVPRLIGHFSLSSRSITLSKDGSPDLSVSEIVSPLTLRRPLGRDGEVSIYLSGVAAISEGDQLESKKSGINDVELSASRMFDSGRYWLGGGLNLPLGEALVESDQVIVSSAVANRILGFRLKRFGEGLDAFVSGARAVGLSRNVVASLGAGYQYKGKYDYRKGEEGEEEEKVSIKPGDEVFLSAGIEGEIPRKSSTLLWKSDVRYRLFMKDERNGEAIYEEGDQVELLLSAGLRFENKRWVTAQAFAVVKGDGSEVDGVGEGSIESMTLEEYLQQGLPGGVQQATLLYGQQVSDRVDATCSVSYSHFNEYSFPGDEPDEKLLGSANIMDAGAGVVYFLSEKRPLSVRGAFLTGSAEDGAVDMSGFDLVVTFQWTY